MAKVQISLNEAKALSSSRRVIPLVETLFSGSETPLSVFEKLAANLSGSFLLESAQQGVWARYSFVGVSNRGALVQETGSAVKWVSVDGKSPLAKSSEILPSGTLDAVAAIQASWNSEPLAGLPPLTSGLVGVMGWDLIREIESLDPAALKDFESPVLALVMLQDLVVLDHESGSLLLISNIYLDDVVSLDDEYRNACQRIDQMRQGLLTPSEAMISDLDTKLEFDFKHAVSESDYLKAVDSAKEYVRAGDVFQVVISKRFDIEVIASALDIYRVLRALNPSPYMYLLNFIDSVGPYSVVGSSPEALVSVVDGRAVTHPIAGSRPRGADTESDAELEKSLQLDAKEKSEHLMLVDLARNDLLKVCEPESVTVTEFMAVHKFSHIMHLVSTVEGSISQGVSPVDVFKATFPAGTLSGAPKPRALEIIDKLEQSNRGIFGGVVGYFDFAGNADLAIAIRTAFIRGNQAHVQAGAGIVLDSIPASEHQETIDKASAPLRAIAAANAMVRRVD
jgi:anthranilate synthase component 1